jgi:hypothetical protein
VDFRWVLDISAPKPPVALVESRVLGVDVAEEDTITPALCRARMLK